MELAGTEWTLLNFETDREMIPALVEAPATLNFSTDGRLSGRSGCNRYFASYSLTNDHLHIGTLGATRMLCRPAQMAQETRYFQALATAGRCEWSQGELCIDYQGGTLRFAKTSE